MMKDKEPTRDKIRTTTAKLVAEHGFSAVKTKRIAEACQVSDGLIFKYFNTLHELFSEVCEHCVTQFTNFAIDAQYDSDFEMTLAFIKAFFEHNMREPDSFLIYVRSKYERPDLLDAIPNQAYHSGLVQELEFRFQKKFGETDGLLMFRALQNMIYHELMTCLLEKKSSPFATQNGAYRLATLFFRD